MNKLKVRSTFVTNSSSSSVVITNITNVPKTIADFLEEAETILKKHLTEYVEGRELYEEINSMDMKVLKLLEYMKNEFGTLVINPKGRLSWEGWDGEYGEELPEILNYTSGDTDSFIWG